MTFTVDEHLLDSIWIKQLLSWSSFLFLLCLRQRTSLYTSQTGVVYTRYQLQGYLVVRLVKVVHLSQVIFVDASPVSE